MGGLWTSGRGSWRCGHASLAVVLTQWLPAIWCGVQPGSAPRSQLALGGRLCNASRRRIVEERYGHGVRRGGASVCRFSQVPRGAMSTDLAGFEFRDGTCERRKEGAVAAGSRQAGLTIGRCQGVSLRQRRR